MTRRTHDPAVIVASVVGAVVVVGALVVTITVLAGDKESWGRGMLVPIESAEPTLSVETTSPTPSVDMSTPSQSATPVDGELEKVQQLAQGLQSNLNYKNVAGLMNSVCADGKAGGAARDDLLRTVPMLNDGHADHSVKVHFGTAVIERDQTEGYRVEFTGTYADGSGRTTSVVFRVYVDNGVANWCGVSVPA
jgi:hypothetical protein